MVKLSVYAGELSKNIDINCVFVYNKIKSCVAVDRTRLEQKINSKNSGVWFPVMKGVS